MSTEQTEPKRLNKHLALILGVSRREADNLIDQHRVMINGTTASLGARFVDGDKITVDDKGIEDEVQYQYLEILFHQHMTFQSFSLSHF